MKNKKMATATEIIRRMIENGDLGEYIGKSYADKKTLGGALTIAQNLIPLASSIGTMLKGNTQGMPAQENVNPYGYREGGKINIKPENKGKFTKKAKAKGKGVQEYARQILANKDNYSTSTVKQANFARNAAKWNRYGGAGFTQYNAPTHEQGGQTVNEQGTPVPNGQAEIEGTENTYNYQNINGKQPYVFSDKNGTSKLVQDIINKRFKQKADLDSPTKNLMEFEIQQVENINEKINELRSTIEQAPMQMRNGGKMKYRNGNPLFVDEVIPKNINLNPLSGLMQTMTNVPDINYNRGRAVPQLPTNNVSEAFASGYNYMTNRDQTTDPIPSLSLPSSIESSTTFNPINEMPPSGLSNNQVGNATANGNKDGVQWDKILRTAALTGNALGLLNRSEKQDLIAPNYAEADRRMGRMNSNLDAARDSVLSQENAARRTARSASQSFGQLQGREAQISANTSEALNRVSLNEQQLRNQIEQSVGQYEATKAVDLANRQYQNQTDNAMNRAMNRNMKRQVLSDILAEADRMSTIKNREQLANASTAEMTAILNNMYPDFTITSDWITKTKQLANGEITQEQYDQFVQTQSPITLRTSGN